MLLLLLDSGLRISELATARLPQLDLQRRQLRVIGNGDKERVVPFGARTAQAMLRYINLHRANPLVDGCHAQPKSYANIEQDVMARVSSVPRANSTLVYDPSLRGALCATKQSPVFNDEIASQTALAMTPHP